MNDSSFSSAIGIVADFNFITFSPPKALVGLIHMHKQDQFMIPSARKYQKSVLEAVKRKSIGAIS